jgi:hypothetical protein
MHTIIMIKKELKKATSLLMTVLLAFSVFNYSAQALVSGYTASLSSMNSGVSEYIDHPPWGGVIHLKAPGDAATMVNEGRIVIVLPDETVLGDITSIQWDVNTHTGYPPHADLILDKNDDGTADDSLTFEFAYQPYVGSGYIYTGPGVPYGHYDPSKAPYYDPVYDVWVSTFQNSETEAGTGSITDSSVAWLGSGLPGPYDDGYFGKLADYKEGTVKVLSGTTPAGVDSDTKVLEIHIEVDNWIGASEAYIDNVAVNGETLIEAVGPTVTIVDPTAATYSLGDIPLEMQVSDIFGIKSVKYNLEDEDSDWVYPSNKVYTGPTVMSGLDQGEYTLYAWAKNNLGITTEASVTFILARLDVEICIHPETLNLRSRGNWITVKIYLPSDVDPEELDLTKVKLWINGESISPEWGTAGDDYVMLKYSRSMVQGKMLSGDEVEIKVTGELPGGGSFEGIDTIRVINPSHGKMISTQTWNGSGKVPKGKQGKPHNNNGNGPKNNNGNGPKNGKH